MVRPKTVNDGSLTCPADSPLDCKQTIDMTVASAEVTIFHVAKGFAHALL
jgi:hypothetical protein